MALREILVPWTQQPQEAVCVDPNHIAGIGEVLISDGSPRIRSLLTDVTYAGSSRSITPGGLAFSGIFNTSQGAMLSQRFSRIAVVMPASLASVGTLSDSNGLAPNSGAQFRIETSGEFSLLKAFVSNICTSSGAGIQVGKISVLGVAYDGANAELFADGRLVGTATNAHSFTTNAALIGAKSGPSESFVGSMLLHADWLFPKSRAEMLSLTANPWQLFEPQRLYTPRRTFSPAWARGANSIIGAGARP